MDTIFWDHVTSHALSQSNQTLKHKENTNQTPNKTKQNKTKCNETKQQTSRNQYDTHTRKNTSNHAA